MVRKLPLSAPQTPADDGSVESDAVRNPVLKRAARRGLGERADQLFALIVAAVLGRDIDVAGDRKPQRRAALEHVGIVDDRALSLPTAASPNMRAAAGP